MPDDSLFRQKPEYTAPKGQNQSAMDANPSELSGTSNPLVRPVWEKFVTNTVAQQNNRGAVQAENDAIRRSSRGGSGAGEIWKGADGRLVRKVGRQTELLDASDYVDHPTGGAEARKSLWDREVRAARREKEDADFITRDPKFKARELAAKDRAAMEAEGSLLPETDQRHKKLKARLIADDEYQAEKASLAQKSWDAEARARQLEATDPEAWWQSRQPQASPTEQRQAKVADINARRDEAQRADDAAAERAAQLRDEMRRGVTGDQLAEKQAELRKIEESRGAIAQTQAAAGQEIEGVKQEAADKIAAGGLTEQITGAKPPKDFFNVGDTISGIWDAVKGLGTTAPAAFFQLVEGMERPDEYSESAKAAFAEADAFNKEMQAKTEANQKAGTSSSVGESFREAGGSLGFSLGSMAAAVPASIAGAKAGGLAGGAIGAAVGAPAAGAGAAPGAAIGASIGATVGGASAAMAASGAAAYRMAGASFLNESFQQLEAESMRKSGRPMNEAEKASAYEALLPIAKNTALWEAGPEAVGNAVTLGAGKIIFGLGKPLASKFATTGAFKAAVTKATATPLQKVGAAAGSLGVELAGETLTNVEQSADQKKATAIAQGQDPNAIKADWSGGGIVESFKEVAPQTLALMGLMGGAGAAVKGVSKATGIGEGSPDAEEKVNLAMAAIDPESAPATKDEINAATLLKKQGDGFQGIAELVMVERELANIEQEDADAFGAAEQALADAQVAGAKPGMLKPLEKAVEDARQSRAGLVRAVLKIAAGEDLSDLTTEELTAIGYESKPAGEGLTEFAPIKAAKGSTPIPTMIRKGDDDSIVLTDAALKKVGQISSRARSRVALGEAEAIKKAKERAEAKAAAELATPGTPGGVVGGDSMAGGSTTPGLQTFAVPMADGTTAQVQAATPEAALDEAAATVGRISGAPAMPVVSPQSTPVSPPAAASSTTAPAKSAKPAKKPADTKIPMEVTASKDGTVLIKGGGVNTHFKHKAGDKVAVLDVITRGDRGKPTDSTSKGNGMKILAQAEAELAKRGVERIEANADNKPDLLKLYEKHGYTIGEKNKDGTVKISKDLKAPAAAPEAKSAMPGFPAGVTRAKTIVDVLDGPQKGRYVVSGVDTKGQIHVVMPGQYTAEVVTGKWKIADEQKGPEADRLRKEYAEMPENPATKKIREALTGKAKKTAKPPTVEAEAEEEQADQIVTQALAHVDKAKKNKRLSSALIIGEERAATRPDGIVINPELIIEEAINVSGMTPEAALEYFKRILDEEIRHLAQYDAAKIEYRNSKSTEPFLDWVESRYAALWESDFTGKNKAKGETVRKLYTAASESTAAMWEAMSPGNKALEAIRIMAQHKAGGVTEEAKLWAGISAELKKAIRVFLASLRKYADVLGPEILQEIQNLENALAKLTDGTTERSPEDSGKKPAETGKGGGNPQPAKTASPGATPTASQPETPRRDETPPSSFIGAHVEFDRDGKTFTGFVTFERGDAIRVKLDDPESDPDGVPTRVVSKKDARIRELPKAPEEKDGDWVAFDENIGSLGIPRDVMPQIKAGDRSALVQFLKARGINYWEDNDVLSGNFSPTQAEYSPSKVKKAKEYEGGSRRILVSSDEYIVDGHHQWLAAFENHERMDVIVLDAPIRKLLQIIHDMPSVEIAAEPAETPEAEAKPGKSDYSDKSIKAEAVFVSGLSRSNADMDKEIAAGNPVGVAVTDALTEPMRNKIVSYVNGGGKLFVDSGAIRAFRGKLVDPNFPETDWSAVMGRYKELFYRIDPDKRSNVYFVGPDIIGDPEATAELQADTYGMFQFIMEDGGNVIVPVQKGKSTTINPGDVDSFWPRDEYPERFVVGIPFKEAAWNQQDVIDYIRRENETEASLTATGLDPLTPAEWTNIHLLGGGADKVESLLAKLAELGLKHGRISGDSFSGVARDRKFEGRDKARELVAKSKALLSPAAYSMAVLNELKLALGYTPVTVTSTVAETGESAEYTRPAAKVIKELKTEKSAYGVLLKCLGGTAS